MQEAEVVLGELVEARGATPEVLELADEAFDKVTLFVKLSVVVSRLFAV